MQAGSYVRYKGVVSIVTSTCNTTAKIMNPRKSGVKLQVKLENLADTGKAAPIVEYKGKYYIVTKFGCIISLTTEKVMKWADNNGDRLGVLQASASYFTDVETV